MAPLSITIICLINSTTIIRMEAKAAFLLLLPFLLATCNAYSLLGPWRLSLDASYPLQPNTSIILDFKQSIENGSIARTLTVLACSLIEFGYETSNGEVQFTIRRVGLNRRQCQQGQIDHLITRVLKLISLSPLSNVVLLLYPSGRLGARLTRLPTVAPLRTLTGQWLITQLDAQAESVTFTANSTQLSLCGGNAVVDYEMSGEYGVRFRVGRVQGCGWDGVLTALDGAGYVRRWGQGVLVHGRDYGLSMRWLQIEGGGANAEEKGRGQTVGNISNPAPQTKPIPQPATPAPPTTSKWRSPSNPQLALALSPNRLVITGDCGTWFSILTLTQTSPSNLIVRNSMARNVQPACFGRGSQIESALNELGRIGVAQREERKWLQLWGRRGEFLAEWVDSL